MKFAPNLSEWSEVFFKQVNQHPFAFERSSISMIYKILGNQNIKAQILIGNAFLLGILYLFIKIFKNLQIPYFYFTPVTVLLFNLTYFENAIWGIAALQNTPTIFFELLTIHLLNLKTNRTLYISICVAILTMFTSGNGLSIWFVGLSLLLLQSRWRHLSIWIVTGISLLTFYFLYDYQLISSDKSNLLKYPFLNIQYVLAFWGNIFFQNIPHPYSTHLYWDIILCIFTGILLLAIIAIICWKIVKIHFHNVSYSYWVLLGGMAFLAFTGLMLVVSRPLEIKIMNGGDVLSRRYMIFGAAFICLGYLNLVKENKRLLKIGVYCFIPIGLCLNISSYYTSLSDLYQQQQELLLDGYYWKNHKMLLSFGEKYGDKRRKV